MSEWKFYTMSWKFWRQEAGLYLSGATIHNIFQPAVTQLLKLFPGSIVLKNNRILLFMNMVRHSMSFNVRVLFRVMDKSNGPFQTRNVPEWI